MSLTSSKARTRKVGKNSTGKKKMTSPNNKCEPEEDDSNAVCTVKRYNLRSYSSPKTPFQIRSKAGKPSNIDSDFLMNVSTSTNKRKDNTDDAITSTEYQPHKANKQKSLAPKKSCKFQKNRVAKTRTPKYAPFSETEEKSIHGKYENDAFCIPNIFQPHKSILKNSPVKSPHLDISNEKDIIKERIYGPNTLKRKKVTFNTMSCNNLEVISFKTIEPKNLKDKTNNYAAAFAVSASEDINHESKKIDRNAPGNKYEKLNAAHMISLNKEDNRNEIAFKSPSKECKVFNENQNFARTQKDGSFQVNEKSKSFGAKSRTLEAIFQNFTKTCESGCKPLIGKKLNPQQSSGGNCEDTKTYDIVIGDENFRIPKNVNIPTTITGCKLFSENKKSFSDEQKHRDFLANSDKSKFSDEKSNSLEQFFYNCTKASDSEGKSPIKKRIRQQSSEENVQDTERNSGVTGVENFKIATEIKIPENLKEFKTLKEEGTGDETENQNLGSGDQGEKLNYVEENILNANEKTPYDIELEFCESANETAAGRMLPPFSTPKFQDDREQQEMNYQEELQKLVGDKLEALNVTFLQKMNDETEHIENLPNLSKEQPAKDNEYKHEICSVAQPEFLKCAFEKNASVKPNEDEMDCLTSVLRTPNAEEFSKLNKSFAASSEETLRKRSFQQKQKTDLNHSEFRSPRRSKIPRLIPFAGDVLSPSAKKHKTPDKNENIVDCEITETQQHLKCNYGSEKRSEKTEDFNEIMLPCKNTSTLIEDETSLVLSTNNEEMNPSTTNDFNSKPEVSDISNYEISVDSDDANADGSEIIEDFNGSFDEVAEIVSDISSKETSMENLSVEGGCAFTDKPVIKNKMPVLEKEKKSGTKVKKKSYERKFISFVVFFILYMVLLNVLNYPSCET